jgi:hypothetical protein
MKAFEYVVDIGSERDIHVELPAATRPGRARVLVLLDDEDEASQSWMSGIAREWRSELADTRQDIYSLDDGEPVDASR